MSILRILDRINSHNDLLQLDNQHREQLCQEIREFLIENVSKTGGHLAGNLGIVELSVAIETVYNTITNSKLLAATNHGCFMFMPIFSKLGVGCKGTKYAALPPILAFTLYTLHSTSHYIDSSFDPCLADKMKG